VIPLRDDTERTRRPLLAAALAAACALAALAVLLAGQGGWTAALLALDAGMLWVFGAGVEGAVGRGWLLTGALFGAIGGAALALAAGASESAAQLAAAAATGAALETIVTHLLRLRGSRILSILPVPVFAGLHEVPAAAWGLAWGGGALALIALGALEA
jgi:hypothetical protein